MNAIDSTTVDSSISTFSVFHLISWRINFSDSSQAASKGILSRSEEHTSELQSQSNLVCRLLLEKKKNRNRSLNYTQQPNANIPRLLLICPATRPYIFYLHVLLAPHRLRVRKYPPMTTSIITNQI